MPKIAVVLIAKNEEKNIGQALDSLIAQDLKPYRIIVVNDGSTDNTETIVKSYSNIELINMKNTSKYEPAKKKLAEVINTGLHMLKNDFQCSFVMKTDADVILPKNYLSEIVKRMELDPKIAVCSGTIENEKSNIPRGAARVVRMDYWRKIGLEYPIKYGYEGYLIVKALTMGYTTKIFSDLVFQILRKTESTYEPKSFYYLGLGMKMIGYTFIVAFVRIVKFAPKNPKGAFYMAKGFLSTPDELYESSVREYVKRHQHKKLKEKFNL